MFSLPEYNILERIALTNKAAVYKAEDAKSRAKILLKIFDNSKDGNDAIAKNDYLIGSSLDYNKIASHISFDTYNTQSVLVLKNIDGVSLKEYINRRFPLFSALKIAISIAGVLEYLHSAGIVHHNICPESFLIDENSLEVSLIDFCYAAQSSEKTVNKKPLQLFDCDVAYISPEQTGRIKGEIDIRSDLYSAGIIFYQLFTGRMPFEETDPLSIVHWHIARQPVAPNFYNQNLPETVCNIVLKLLAKKPAERYQSPYGLKMDLERCFNQWGDAGKIQQFKLGINDYSGSLQTCDELFGREKEAAILTTIYEKVKSGSKEILLVQGSSGVGKSALIHQIKKQVIAGNAFFVEAKFNQIQINIPYFGFIEAFRQFTDFILSQNIATTTFWTEQILKAVGINGKVLTDIIPHLELLIGSQPPIVKLEPNETQNRLQYVVINFIKCIAKKEYPLIIFFDDVQWADAASSNLMKTLFSENDLQYFCLLAAERPRENDEVDVFNQKINEIISEGFVVNKIPLQFLPYNDVEKMVSAILGCEKEKIKQLSALTFSKSHGNPFFITAFLQFIFIEKALVFNFHQHTWEWDEDRITRLGISGNVVDLMIGRIQKFSAQTQQVLKMAACLGYSFNIRLLEIVLAQPGSQIVESLTPAISEGLVLSDGDVLQFAHDRIQQATYSLIPQNDKELIHLTIGQTLLQHLDGDENNNFIFDTVNQLNAGKNLLAGAGEKNKLAVLNLRAGTKAKSTAAYKMCYDYLCTGIGLLSVDCWQNNYALALQLYNEGAESCLLCDFGPEMESRITVILANAANILDSVKAYEIKIRYLIAHQQLLEAVETSFKIFAHFDIYFPRNPTKLDILKAILKIKGFLARRPAKNLIYLPRTKNASAEAAIHILAIVGSAVYFAMPKLFPLFALKSFDLMIKNGNTNYSGIACAGYGIIVLGGLGNINEGYQLSKVAIELAEKFEASSFKFQCIMMVNNFILHWKEHLNTILGPLHQNYFWCLETGNNEFACLSAVLYCLHSFFCGVNLKQLTSEMFEFLALIQQLKQETSISLHKIHLQGVLNLHEHNDAPNILTGRVHNEPAMLAIYNEGKAENLIFDVYLFKLLLGYFFRHYEDAEESSKVALARIDSVIATPEVVIFYFYDTLNKIALIERGSKSKKIAGRVYSNITKLKKFARLGPMNCLHKLLLVQAELYRINGNLEKAGLYFDKAIQEAASNNYTNDGALVCELAGKFYLQRQKALIAKYYLLQAYQLYSQWGAWMKVKDIETQYAYIFEGNSKNILINEFTVPQIANAVFPGNNNLREYDLNSILKASNAISSEVELDRLLNNLVKIAVENAGAQKGYLILPKENDFFIEAVSSVNTAQDAALQAIPVSGHPDILESVVRFVCSTKENLVIGDVSQSAHFDVELNDRENSSKSILCMPIVNQGIAIGILYLKNDLLADAFTSDKIEVLKLLSGQMAISLQNAFNEKRKIDAFLEREKLLAKISLHDQELLKTKLEIQEQTLNNISAEIHDNIGQTLSFIKLSLNSINIHSADMAQGKINELKALLSKVIQDLRDLAKTFNADYINKFGIVSGIDQQIQFLNKTELFAAELFVKGNEVRFEPYKEIVVFRIIQELLNNIVKHAEASEIKIVMNYEVGNLSILVHDNGKGFNVEDTALHSSKGLGITNIFNRINLVGGTVQFKSEAKKGTAVKIDLTV